MVVPEQGRPARVQGRAEAAVGDRDRRPDRAARRGDGDRSQRDEPAVSDLYAVDDGIDVVQAAPVLGHRRATRWNEPLALVVVVSSTTANIGVGPAEVVHRVRLGVEPARWHRRSTT